MEHEWEITISHSYREANMCADGLADVGGCSSTNLIEYDNCPKGSSHSSFSLPVVSFSLFFLGLGPLVS